MFTGTPTAAHFIYIPVVLIFGIVIGWILGSRAAQDAFAMELKKREARKARESGVGSRESDGSRKGT